MKKTKKKFVEVPPTVPPEEQVYSFENMLKCFELRGYEPYSRARIYQLIEEGKFPEPVKLSGQMSYRRRRKKDDNAKPDYSRSGFLKHEIDAWFAARLKKRSEDRWRPASENYEPELEERRQ